MHSSSARIRPGALGWIVLGAIGLAALACVVQPLVELPVHAGRNHNEGWNAFHAASVLDGRPLYPPADALVSNNYPPLSFLVVAAFAGGSGDTLVTGRVVALVSLLVVVVCVGWIGSRVAGSTFLGWFAGLLAFGTLGAHYQNYVAMNDPQMLGHALQFVGLALLVGRGARRWAVIVSVLLMIFGGLAKHNLLPVPLGVAAWMVFARRPWRGTWIVTAVVGAAATFGLLLVAFGPNLVHSVIGHAREYEVYLFLKGLERWFLPITPLLIGSLAAALLPSREERVGLILVIAGVAFGFGVLTSFGTGMNYNALFDLVFVGSILCAVAVAELAERAVPPRGRWLLPVAMVAFASNSLFVTPMRAYRTLEVIEELPEVRRAAREDVELVRSLDGPVMCEDPSLAYWAGKQFEVDFFNLSQKVATGAMPDAAIAERIARREFALIQFDRPDHSPFLTDETNQAVRENYELLRRSEVNGYLFVPRDPS